MELFKLFVILAILLLPTQALAVTSAVGAITTSGSTCIMSPSVNPTCVQVPTSGGANGTVNVTGTWTGTLSFEGSINQGVGWFPVTLSAVGGSTPGTTTTTNGTWAITDALTNIRVRASGAMTGSAIAHLYTTQYGGGGTSSGTFSGSIGAVTQGTVPWEVAGALTDTELRASPVPVAGPLTDTELRASSVPVTGTVTANGPLTDAQLRATPVPVSGTVTATGPATDAQLRATPLPVTGPLTDPQLRATPVPVDGPLTDTQLRATPPAVTGAKSNNSATAADNIGTLPGVASAAAPSNSEGNSVKLSCALNGSCRVYVPDGGLTPTFFDSAASNNAANITSVPTIVESWDCTNSSTTASFWFKLYNVTGVPAPAADTGATVLLAKHEISRASATGVLGGMSKTYGTSGLLFPLGLGRALTAAQANNDNTSATANVVTCNIQYRLKVN